MSNLLYRSTKSERRIIRSYWLVIAVLILIVPVKRVLAQFPERSTEPLFMESVWLITDRTIYLPGEAIKFSAIVVETDTYRPSQLSRILKVELLDKDGNRLVQREYYLDSSRVNQVIPIPTSLSSNWYFLRAYTNWMRNSPEAINNLYPIKIIHTNDLNTYAGENNHQSITASVFPENSKLVADRMNHCAVRIRSNDGDHIETKAALVSNSNDTVSRFSTDQTGWGVFSFTPSIDGNYRVAIPGSQGLIINTKIPSPETDLPFTIFKADKDSIMLSISNVKCEQVKILFHRDYTFYKYFNEDVRNGTVVISILTSSLPYGLMQCTLLAPDNTILFKRLFINKDHIGLQPEISIEKSAINPDVVYAEVNDGATISTGSQLVNLIVSREEPSDLFDLYMPGIPGWHFTYDIPVTLHALEGWLIANHYPDEVARSFLRFDGAEQLSLAGYRLALITELESLYRFLPETRGFTLSGNVVDGGGNPVPNQIVTATLLSNNNLHAGYTYPSGRFHLFFPERTGLEDIVVSFTSKPPSDWNILIDPQFDTSRFEMPIRSFNLTTREAEYIRDIDVNRQLNSIYKKEEQNIIEEQVKSPEQVSFYGNPEKVTLVDDYIKLSNIREVIYEVVPGVTVRKRGGSYMLGIFGDPPLPSVYDPLFRLDGIPMIDFDDFLELPSGRFREIRQLNQLYIHGNVIFSGIVDFESVNNDMAGLGLPDKSKLLSIFMPFRSVNWNIPEQISADGNIPQLSNILYWESFIDTAIESFSFIANDNPGTYVSRITGFNSNGQWIHNKRTIAFGIDNTPH